MEFMDGDLKKVIEAACSGCQGRNEGRATLDFFAHFSARFLFLLHVPRAVYILAYW